MFTELDLLRVKEVIRELASIHGVSEESIRVEMEHAINAGYNNPDPAVKGIWDDTPFRGTRPSPEEFILWCALQADS